MKALRLTATQQSPDLLDVDIPVPGPGEVLVKVGGAGACHSDLHLMEFSALPWSLPFTLGHETAGWVAEAGPAVTGLADGDPVAVYGAIGCGRCPNCRAGSVNYCDHGFNAAIRDLVLGLGGDPTKIPPAATGIGADGGMAEYILVSASCLVPLGSLDPEEDAPLTDAGLTPYHAVKRSLSLLHPGSAAVVIGVGGLGHMAIQILRAVCATHIIAVDVSESKLALAREVGADETILSVDDAQRQIISITGGRGAEAVFDFVGSDATIALGAQVVRPQGHLTVVGLAGGTFSFNYNTIPYECALATVYWGSLPELHEVIALAAAGRITVHAERFSLEGANDAYERMKAGTLEGRAVIVPGS